MNHQLLTCVKCGREIHHYTVTGREKDHRICPSCGAVVQVHESSTEKGKENSEE